LDRPATRVGGIADGPAGVAAAGPDGGAADAPDGSVADAPDGRAADAPDGGAAHAQDDGAAAARSGRGAAAGDGCNVALDRAAAPSVIVPADRVQLSSSLSPRPHVCVFAAVHKLCGPSMKQTFRDTAVLTTSSRPAVPISITVGNRECEACRKMVVIDGERSSLFVLLYVDAEKRLAVFTREVCDNFLEFCRQLQVFF